jgi:hypothetical protein
MKEGRKEVHSGNRVVFGLVSALSGQFGTCPETQNNYEISNISKGNKSTRNQWFQEQFIEYRNN